MNKKRLFLFAVVLTGVLFWSYEKYIDNVHIRYFYLDNWPKVSKISYSKEEIEHARKILQPPFSYLGKGRQFFVFESQDKKYVLKFLKCQRYDVWYENIAFLKEKAKERKEVKREKLASTFSSLYLSQTMLADVTGVVYCHLQQKADLQARVKIVDPLGFSHTLLVDDVPFVLQKKAQHVFSTLEQCNNTDELKNRLNQLIQLQVNLVKLGCIDCDDGALMRNNIGFLSDRAIYIDVGTFSLDDSANKRFEEDLERLYPVTKWLKQKNPQLTAWFERQLQKTCLENAA